MPDKDLHVRKFLCLCNKI